MPSLQTITSMLQLARFGSGNSMAISHELSGEIATALFAAKKRSPRELNDLKEMIFKIHYTLQQLADDARNDRRKSRSQAKKPPQDN